VDTYENVNKTLIVINMIRVVYVYKDKIMFESAWNAVYEYTIGFRAKTPAELLSDNKRAMARATRELDRETNLVRRDEKKLMHDIRDAAKANDTTLVKTMAKDLVRKRACIQRFHNAKMQIDGLSTRLSTAKSAASMAETMASATRTMNSMSKHLNVPAFQRIMVEFSKQNAMIDTTSEMMDDTMDDVFEDESDATDELVEQVLDELGCTTLSGFVSPPIKKQQQIVQENVLKDALLERLENLKK
jgi:charged multivesicular body protein 2A